MAARGIVKKLKDYEQELVVFSDRRCAWRKRNARWCMEEPSPKMAGPPFYTAIGGFVAFACLCL